MTVHDAIKKFKDNGGVIQLNQQQAHQAAYAASRASHNGPRGGGGPQRAKREEHTLSWDDDKVGSSPSPIYLPLSLTSLSHPCSDEPYDGNVPLFAWLRINNSHLLFMISSGIAIFSYFLLLHMCNTQYIPTSEKQASDGPLDAPTGGPPDAPTGNLHTTSITVPTRTRTHRLTSHMWKTKCLPKKHCRPPPYLLSFTPVPYTPLTLPTNRKG